MGGLACGEPRDRRALLDRRSYQAQHNVPFRRVRDGHVSIDTSLVPHRLSSALRAHVVHPRPRLRSTAARVRGKSNSLILFLIPNTHFPHMWRPHFSHMSEIKFCSSFLNPQHPIFPIGDGRRAHMAGRRRPADANRAILPQDEPEGGRKHPRGAAEHLDLLAPRALGRPHLVYFISPPTAPISPICRTPLSPISQNLFLIQV